MSAMPSVNSSAASTAATGPQSQGDNILQIGGGAFQWLDNFSRRSPLGMVMLVAALGLFVLALFGLFSRRRR